jgi:hypothetical protein
MTGSGNPFLQGKFPICSGADNGDNNPLASGNNGDNGDSAQHFRLSVLGSASSLAHDNATEDLWHVAPALTGLNEQQTREIAAAAAGSKGNIGSGVGVEEFQKNRPGISCGI